MADQPKPTVVMIGTGTGNMRALAPDARPVEIVDSITAAPDIIGPHGRGWKCNLDETRRIMGVRPEDDGTLAHWVVEAPWAHPCWHSYSLMLIHLRPMPDGRKTKLYLPCASHEMWLYALDPHKERGPMISNGIAKGRWLNPMNFGAQFVELSDADALARIERTVREICDGVLSPDTDYQRQWVERFGDSMIKREYR